MKEYSWTIASFYKEDANEVGQELEKLDELTPTNVVELARNEESILHNMFEWDDSIAGEKYRKIQAGKIITNLVVNVVSEEPEEEPKQVRAFVTLKRESKYEPIEKIVKDTDRYALLLEKAYRELNAIKRKYDNLTEIQELLADIPDVD